MNTSDSTLKYWFVANIELFMALLSVVIAAIYLLIFPFDDSSLSIRLLATGFLLFGLNIQTKEAKFKIFFYFLILIGLIFVTYVIIKDDSMTSHERTLYTTVPWIVFSIISFFSGWLAIYAYNNFEEVVSRRMMWRNSNVSLFEIAIKYAFERFCSISFSFVTCFAWIWFVVYIQTTYDSDIDPAESLTQQEANQMEEPQSCDSLAILKEIQSIEVVTINDIHYTDIVIEKMAFREYVIDTILNGRNTYINIQYPVQFRDQEVLRKIQNFFLCGYATIEEYIIDLVNDDSFVQYSQFENASFVNDILSYSSNVYGFKDGEPVQSSVSLHNFDLSTGEMIKNNDLFGPDYVDFVVPLIIKYLLELFEVDTYEQLEERLLVKLHDITPPENFSLSAYGITYVYNRNEITDYAVGVIMVFIPYDALPAAILFDNSLIYKYLN